MPAMDTDVEYSIGVNNRFGNLDFEVEDPSDLFTQLIEKEPKADKKAKSAKPAKSQEKTQQIHRKEVTIDDSRKDGFRQDKLDKADRRDRIDRAERGSGRGERSRGRGQRGRGRGRGGFNQDRDRNGEQTEDRGRFDRSERGGFDRSERGGFDRPERSGFGRFQDSREDRLDGEPRPSGGFPMEGDNSERENFRRGGGMGRGRGRDSGRGGRGRGRQFDRRSGSDRSGVKPTDKREGSGSFNWGTPQDELEASRESHQVFLTAEEEIKDWAEACEPTEVAEEPKEQGDEDGTQPPQDEAVKQMTLDEYKEVMERERAKVTFNLRKANEGEKMPKDIKTIKKKNEEEEEEEGSLFFPRRLIEEKVKTSGRVREQLKLDLKYGESDSRLAGGEGRGRRRGGRRGGGGGGGGGPRGGGRGRGGEEEGKSGGFGSRGGFGPRSGGFGSGAADDSALNLESKDEFPSLS